MKRQEPSEFEKAARREEGQGGLLLEFWAFLRENKKWWLLPILILFLILGGLILLQTTGLAPFIYTLF
jgi:hypothetical protein